jgi:hypothetical protein
MAKKTTQNKTGQAQSVEALLAQLNIDVLTVSREITCRCPFHEDRHPSFSINATSGLWICYQCGASGNLDKLLTDVGGETNPRTSLREIRRARISQAKPIYTVEEKYDIPDPYYLCAQYESFDSPPRWALEEKYIDDGQAERYGLRWRKGWILPIWGPRTTRDPVIDLWGWQFKREDFVSNYPRRVKKSQTLFGLAQLWGRTALLVESPLDVVRLASAGVPAVASYGAMVSRYQLGLLEGRLDRLVLALDDDREGRAQTERIYPVLGRRLPTRVLRYEGGVKDLGEATDAQVESMVGKNMTFHMVRSL